MKACRDIFHEGIFLHLPCIYYIIWAVSTMPSTAVREAGVSRHHGIVFTIFRLIWNQTDVRLDLNQPENVKYNLISG